MTTARLEGAWRPRAVLFDLDNTLYDHRRASRATLAILHERWGLKAAGATLDELVRAYFEINQRMWLKLATREIDVKTLRAARVAALFDGLALTPPRDPADLGREYLELYATFSYPFAGAEETLAALSARLPLGLLTNGFTDIQRPKVSRLGWDRYFRWLGVAEELDAFKPDPAIFTRMCERMALAPGDVLYCGDSPVEDIIPARTAGLRSCWLRREGPEVAAWNADAEADYEVADITDVTRVVEGLL